MSTRPSCFSIRLRFSAETTLPPTARAASNRSLSTNGSDNPDSITVKTNSTVMMLAIAALIEGFFRQMVNDTGIRYAVMSVTVVLWAWFFTRAGREPAE